VQADTSTEAAGAVLTPPAHARAFRRETYVNPVLDGGPEHDHGDPFVLEYLGEYFLYHSGPHGVTAYRSEDMLDWSYAGIVLTGAGDGHWAQIELWAPEVFRRNGEFVMYVAATRHGVSWRHAGKAHGADGGDDDVRRQGVARSVSPLGPFIWDDAPLVSEWSIDGHLFQDDDGSEWLFYNVRNDATRHVNGTLGCGNVVDRVGPDGSLAGTPTPVTYPSEAWEGNDAADQYWNEAPWTLKRRGRYFQMYSGGFFGGDGYSLGVAVADEVAGPYTKVPGPVFVSGERITGPGHHCVTVAPDGVTPYAIYHGYVGEGFGRKVHADLLRWAGDRPHVGRGAIAPSRPDEAEQPAPPAAKHDPAVAPFALRAWLTGQAAAVAGVPVALTGATPCLLEARYDGQRLLVRRDGVVVADLQGVTADPGIQGGTTLHLAVTSHLDDEREHTLAAGDDRSWVWGGSRPVECSLAVRGSVRVTLGDVVVDVVAADGGYELVTLTAPAAAVLRVDARGPASIADVVLTTR
jgi:GH43 family beta-xylosidase